MRILTPASFIRWGRVASVAGVGGTPRVVSTVATTMSPNRRAKYGQVS